MTTEPNIDESMSSSVDASPNPDVEETTETTEVPEVIEVPGLSEVMELTEDLEPTEASEALEGEEIPETREAPDTADLAGLGLGDPQRLGAAIEALLFVVEAPVSAAAIAAVVQRPTAEVEAALAELAKSYAVPGRGVELRWVGDGVRIYTRPELSVVVEAFLLDGQRTRLSQAALETLAVIAYRQPVTRGRISAIRGVNVDGVVRTLVSRGLIVEDGTESDSGAGLYRTTAFFLERMGLQSLDELPSLAPLLPEIDTLETDEL